MSILLCCLLLSACASGTIMTKPTKTPTSQPPTIWQTLLSHVKEGRVDLTTALQAFSLAIGPLPGVQVPTGPTDDIDSGTIAIAFVQQHWSELSAPQQQAVTTDLTAPFANGQSVTVPPPSSHMMTSGRAASAKAATPVPPPVATPTNTEFQAMITDLVTQYAAPSRLNRQLPFAVTFSDAPTPAMLATQHQAPAWSALVDAQGNEHGVGKPVGCRIYVNPSRKLQDARTNKLTLAHEVFHCYQGVLFPTIDAFYAVSPWLLEGMARWASVEILRPLTDSAYSSGWSDYLTTPEMKLTDRSYDAFGFYVQLVQATSLESVWHVVDQMLLASSDAAAFGVAAALGGEKFLNSWAAGYSREWGLDMQGIDAWGPDWSIRQAVDFDSESVLATTPITTAAFPVAALPYALKLYELAPKTEVVTFGITGHARFHDEGSLDAIIGNGSAYCAAKSGCSCPPGSAYAGPPLTPLTGRVFLALTGSSTGTQGSVQGMDLKDFCDHAQVKLTDATGTCTRNAVADGQVPINESGPCSYTFTPHQRLATTQNSIVAGLPFAVDTIFDVETSTDYVGGEGQWDAFHVNAGSLSEVSPYWVWEYDHLQGATTIGTEAVDGTQAQHVHGTLSVDPRATVDVWVAVKTGFPLKWIATLNQGNVTSTETILFTQWNTGIAISLP